MKPPADPRAAYAAERARLLKAQARRRPADPQSGGECGAAPATRQPCATPVSRADPWRVCGDPQLSHWVTSAGNVTWCSIATAAGRCGCERFSGQHHFDADGRGLTCGWCGVYVFDVTGPCEGR